MICHLHALLPVFMDTFRPVLCTFVLCLSFNEPSNAASVLVLLEISLSFVLCISSVVWWPNDLCRHTFSGPAGSYGLNPVLMLCCCVHIGWLNWEMGFITI